MHIPKWAKIAVITLGLALTGCTVTGTTTPSTPTGTPGVSAASTAPNRCYHAAPSKGKELAKVHLVPAKAAPGYAVGSALVFRSKSDKGQPIPSPVTVAPGSNASQLLWIPKDGWTLGPAYVNLSDGSGADDSGDKYLAPKGKYVVGVLICLTRRKK